MPFSARTGFFFQAGTLPDPDYPNWPTQANVSQFNTEVALYSGVASTSIEETITGLPTNEAYRGNARHPNGKIYYFPRNAGSVLEYDPSTNTSTDRDPSSLLGGSKEFTGGSIGANGNIYLAPFNSTQVYEYSPTNDTAREITVSVSGAISYNGAVTDKAGNVYCIPQNETKFIKIDTSTEPVTISYPTFGASYTNAGYISGTAHPNGNIYCVGGNFNNFLEIDTVNETSRTLGTLTDNGFNFQGCVTGADGNIYGVPYQSGYVAMLEPSTTTVTEETFGLTIPSQGYIGGTAAPNGNIYMASFQAGNTLEIDPVAQTAQFLHSGTVGGGDAFVGACSDQANVYLCPNNRGIAISFAHNGTGGSNANAYTLSSYVISGH